MKKYYPVIVYITVSKFQIMIDTIKARVPSAIYKRTFEKVTNLEGFELLRNGGNYQVWRIPNTNMIVTVGTKSIKIYGSLPKFYHGNNLQDLTYTEMLDAINALSDILHTSVWKADLIRADFGRTFSMLHTPKNYMDCFIDSPGFIEYSRMNGETKRYGKSNYQLLFYDKNLEFFDKNGHFPDDFKYTNRLRYEIEIKKHFAQQFRYSRLKVVQLMSQTFLRKLEDLWRKSYFKVYKTNSIQLLPNANWQQLRDFYLISGIQKTTGIEVAVSMIDDLNKNEAISRQNRFDFLNLIRNAFTNISIAKQVYLLKELEQKILVPVVEQQ